MATTTDLDEPRDLGDELHDPGACARVQWIMELVGRRWTGVILLALFNGACRYSEIRAATPGLSDTLLSERLRELEASGLVTRTVIPETPVAIRYALTPRGRGLWRIFDAVAAWLRDWGDEPHPARD